MILAAATRGARSVPSSSGPRRTIERSTRERMEAISSFESHPMIPQMPRIRETPGYGNSESHKSVCGSLVETGGVLGQRGKMAPGALEALLFPLSKR
jgi:hypothetical protein